MKCPCGQTFIYNSDRDQEMKMQLHKKVCPNPPEVVNNCDTLINLLSPEIDSIMILKEYEGFTSTIRNIYPS